MSFFNSLVQRIGYGAIMYNGNSSALVSCYPFFTSRSNFTALPSLSSSGTATTISINDVDDYWTVMPGYKLEVYNGMFYSAGILLTGDNTTGVVPVNYTISPANQASSIKLYFNNTLIQDPGDSVPLFNGSSVTVSNYATTTYDIAFGTTYYHVYEFYTGSTGTLSFTGSSNVSNIQCLLVGGGGGGGNYFSGNTGAGGGGAGTFAHATFTAIPGSTFTITVGAGGAGGGGNSNNPGLVGSLTSITRTVNSVVDATLNAGGGGGGGSLNGQTGNNQSYGSSAGGYGTNSATLATSYTATGSAFTVITAATFRGGSGVGSGTGGGGGGGAGAAGSNGAFLGGGGPGGAGRAWTVIPARSFAGGGGGMNSTNGGTAGGGGTGGGGAGYSSATPNTGSGGGASFGGTAGGSGGSGICIIAIPV